MSDPSLSRLCLLALALAACGAPEPAATPTPAPATPTPLPEVDVYALAAPILPSQEEAWRGFVAELEGERAEAHRRRLAEHGVTRERVWLQRAPDGPIAVVYFEGSSVDQVMARRAASDHPHDVWFVEQVAALHGLGSEPPPPNELVFRGDVPGVEGETAPYALAAPIPRDAREAFLEFVAALEQRSQAWRESRRAKGIAREYVWLQPGAPGDAYAVVYFEATDASGIVERLLAPSELEFDAWFREQVAEIHGLEPSEPPPPNELVME